MPPNDVMPGGPMSGGFFPVNIFYEILKNIVIIDFILIFYYYS